MDGISLDAAGHIKDIYKNTAFVFDLSRIEFAGSIT